MFIKGLAICFFVIYLITGIAYGTIGKEHYEKSEICQKERGERMKNENLNDSSEYAVKKNNECNRLLYGFHSVWTKKLDLIYILSFIGFAGSLIWILRNDEIKLKVLLVPIISGIIVMQIKLLNYVLLTPLDLIFNGIALISTRTLVYTDWWNPINRFTERGGDMIQHVTLTLKGELFYSIAWVLIVYLICYGSYKLGERNINNQSQSEQT